MRRALVALAALLVLTGCGSDPDGLASVQGGDGWHGTRLDEAWQPSDKQLTTDRGKRFALTQADDGLRLVFFGYTKCPDVCQVVMGTIASSLARLDADERKRVEVDFVTTDPARDTGSVLREYLDRFDPAYVGVTGPIKQIVDVATSVHVYVADGRKLPGGGYDVDHTAAVIGLQDGEARMVWTQGVTPPDLAEDVKKLLKEHS